MSETKHTYQLRFNTGSYAELLPSNSVILKGEWETGTMIWREKISGIKIGRAKNATIYDTLESYFEDDTKFTIPIYIKVLKDSVEKSVHKFGVKWGKLNKDVKTYSVQPVLYDLWGQYFEATKDISIDRSVPGTVGTSFYNVSGTYQWLANMATEATIKEVVLDLSTDQSGWLEANIVSSFIWQSNYEGGGAVGTFQGMPLDYVTGEQSYLKGGGMITGQTNTFSDLLEWLTLFRTFVFFDSNDKLRFEHIKFFNDKLNDNAVDYSAFIKSYDNEWSYEDSSIPVVETFEMNEDDYDKDFSLQNVVYSDLRNRSDTQTIAYTSSLFSQLTTGSYQEALNVWAGLYNHVYKWFDEDMDDFDSDFNSFDVEWDVSAGDVNFGSNDFVTGQYQPFAFYADIAGISGEFTATIFDRSAATAISNVITVNSVGTTSGTITTTESATDAYLHIRGTVSNSGAADGWITLDHPSVTIIPTIDGIKSASPKTNGAMSMANIFEKWWQDDRAARKGTYNSTLYTFDGTRYNLKRKDIRIYYSGVINPLYGFNDGTRVGRIRAWEHDLDTDFYQIEIEYQEDE